MGGEQRNKKVINILIGCRGSASIENPGEEKKRREDEERETKADIERRFSDQCESFYAVIYA